MTPPESSARRSRVAVVVLGDVGRSPRMQYHALALADRLANVELIGLAGTEPFPALRRHPHIRLRLLPDSASPSAGDGAQRPLLVATGRAVRQAGGLLRALLGAPPPDAILVQNPPAVPTLAVGVLAARLRRARMIIDWHNLGHAMVALRLGRNHPGVRLVESYERILARRADAHLCVSHAMQAALAQRWGLTATVLHDRPAGRFAPLAPGAREAAIRDLCARVGVAVAHPRPAVIVSATSWTADEDFELLLAAIGDCERRLAATDGPSLLFVISGRGTLRAAYDARLARLPARRVRVVTLWVEADEYPRLLAAADVGLCLHRSASGLDLPMKIADMFGAGLPVLALDYGACLREQVDPGETALLFSTPGELAARLCELLGGFPSSIAALDRLRAAVCARAAGERWDDAWTTHARPLFEAALGRAPQPRPVRATEPPLPR